MATIVMQAEEVKKAAQAVIDRIMAVRKQKDEEMIANRMKTKAFSFKRWFYYMTREEAIADLSSDPFRFPSYKSWGTLGRAEELLLIAEHGDPVTLDQDDVSVLFRNT